MDAYLKQIDGIIAIKNVRLNVRMKNDVLRDLNIFKYLAKLSKVDAKDETERKLIEFSRHLTFYNENNDEELEEVEFKIEMFYNLNEAAKKNTGRNILNL